MTTVVETFTDYIDVLAEAVEFGVSVLHTSTVQASDVVTTGVTLTLIDDINVVDSSFPESYALLTSSATVSDTNTSSVTVTAFFRDRVRVRDSLFATVSEFYTSNLAVSDSDSSTIQLTGTSNVIASDNHVASTNSSTTVTSRCTAVSDGYVSSDLLFTEAVSVSDTPIVRVFPATLFVDALAVSDTFSPSTRARPMLFTDRISTGDQSFAQQVSSDVFVDSVHLRTSALQTVSPGAP